MKIYEKLKITRNSLKLRELEHNAKREQHEQEYKDVEARAASAQRKFCQNIFLREKSTDFWLENSNI